MALMWQGVGAMALGWGGFGGVNATALVGRGLDARKIWIVWCNVKEE
jgi:hypothetical protein